MRINSLLLTILLLAPTVGLGMSSLSDRELGEVTAQVGITTTFDDFIMYQSFGKIAFADLDGGKIDKYPNYCGNPDESGKPPYALLGLARGASLNLENVEIDCLRVNAIAYEAATLLRPASIVNTGEQNAKYEKTTHAFTGKPMIIDVVDKLPILSAGWNYMFSSVNNDFGKKYLFGLTLPVPMPTENKYNREGIVIGLPTLDIYIDEFNIGKITVTSEESITGRVAVNNGYSMGQISMKGIDAALLSGIYEFSPHIESGIDIALDDINLYLKINEISFSDTDGLTPGANPTPASLVFKNIEADLLRINGLTLSNFDLLNLPDLLGSTLYGLTPEEQRVYMSHLIGESKFVILSAGQEPAHLEDLNNVVMLDLIDVKKSWHGQPLMFDMTRSLGLTAIVEGANLNLSMEAGTPFSIGGVEMPVGTMEVYADALNIGQITIRDDAAANKAANDGASFFPISMKKAQADTLTGIIEISPH